MGSLGVCATACNLHSQRLCYLSNGLRRHAASGIVTRNYTKDNLSSFNVHVRHLSTTLSSSNVRFKNPLSDRANVGPRQYTANITTTTSLHSESSQDSRNKPDDRPELDEAVAFVQDQHLKTPWQRECCSRTPPVRRERSASAMTKGKLLTTPSRLLKLVLPVTTEDYNGDRKDIEPLALLLHPQQPLSYLERLIQAEVPPIKDRKTGKIHPPHVEFLAIEAQDETIQPKKPKAKDLIDEDKKYGQEGEVQDEESKSMVVTKSSQAPRLRDIPDNGDNRDNNKALQNNEEKETRTEEEIEAESKRTGSFVRWSSSTEIGDFIRDAARVKEFLVEIENSPLGRIPVAVPSFNDRTYYLRMRLRKLSKNLKHLAIIKHECDILAHRGAQRVALGGLGVMVSWWYIVYKLTFETDYGWDTMEPITYLVSLSTLMGGYTWFLYHNREISYRSALDFTVNRRQQKLYQTRGIDLQVWESLIDEANSLRREIKTVAEEYDVDWDERADEEDERVTEALKHERRQKERKEEKEKKREKEEAHSEGGD